MATMVTGHRPGKVGGFQEPNPTEQRVRRALRRAIEERIQAGETTFVSGMALGVDTWFAEEVLDLRDQGAAIRLIAAIPFAGQAKIWPMESQRRWAGLCRRADQRWLTDANRRVSVEELQELYRAAEPRHGVAFLLTSRNTWMVARTNRVIAVWDGSGGGTAHAVNAAKRAGHGIVVIDPNEEITP